MVAARPPYLPLATLLCVPPASSRLRAWAGVAAIGLVTVSWTSVLAAPVRVPLYHAGVSPDPAAQLAHLVARPVRIVALGLETMREYGARYVHETVGVLGYLDVFLPWPYLVAAGIAVILAAAVGSTARPSSRLVAVSLASVVVSAGGIWLSQYLLWTPVGARIVEGVQGRYLLPCAMAACVLVPRRGADGAFGRWARLWVAATPAAGFVAIWVAIARRYYQP
jgi:uncharacterized membrane protein